MGKKIDFHDFVRNESEKFGLDPSDLYGLEDRVAVLLFERDRKNNVTARHKGEIVFPDRVSGYIIGENELWICSVEKAQLGISHAKPLFKIDGAFLYSLKAEQIDRMVDQIWERNRASLEPRMDEKYKSRVDEAIGKMVEEERRGSEERMMELQETIDDLERTAAEDRSIIESLQARLKERDAAGPALGPAPMSPLAMSFPELTVRRTGPDQIESETFTHPRYFVHVSADTRLMVVRPHESGNVLCVDGRINLEGLNMLIPFSQEQTLVADYSGQHGGIRILLK